MSSTFLKIIRELRKSAGLTQRDVSLAIGCDRTLYGRKEGGKVTMSADELVELLAFLRGKADPEKYAIAMEGMFGKKGPRRTTPEAEEDAEDALYRDKYIELLEKRNQDLERQLSTGTTDPQDEDDETLNTQQRRRAGP